MAPTGPGLTDGSPATAILPIVTDKEHSETMVSSLPVCLDQDTRINRSRRYLASWGAHRVPGDARAARSVLQQTAASSPLHTSS
jgi:hypothetical protein